MRAWMFSEPVFFFQVLPCRDVVLFCLFFLVGADLIRDWFLFSLVL
jgi:hypothetical protein